jgi:hypothetical protein
METKQVSTQIGEAVDSCEKAGYKPVALLVNPKVLEILNEEIRDYPMKQVKIAKFFGLTVTARVSRVSSV